MTFRTKQGVQGLLSDQARTIRIPVHMIETINKIVRTTRQMLHSLGREPTPEELANELSIPIDKVQKVMKIVKEPVSLETLVGDEEDSSMGDFIENKTALMPIDAAIQEPARDQHPHPRFAHPAGRVRAVDALRHRHEHRPYS